MWLLFCRRRWRLGLGSKNTGSVVTGVVIGLFVSFALRRVSYSSTCIGSGLTISATRKTVVTPSPAPAQEPNADNHLNEPPAAPPKGLLLVGVMTANKYLKSRAKSTFKTWGQDVPGKIIYFTGANSSMKTKDAPVPLVMLPGVDDSYPPQKKSFMMLKYMFDNYGDKYEWFMRTDDDVYIRMDLLTKLLRSIDSTKMHFIGQAGLGTDSERGRLHLGPNENFCMGGPGIIFSRSTLEKLVANIDSCLKNVKTTHEDVELGRCVSLSTGLACTWSYEMQKLFHHKVNGPWQFFKNHKYRQAITLHPLKNHASLFQLHSHFLGLKVQELAFELVKVNRDLYDIGSNVEPSLKNTGLSPSLTKYSPANASNILTWDFLSGSKTLFTDQTTNPRASMTPAERENLRNSAHELLDIVNNVSKVRGREAEMKNLIYGYHRVDPLHGEDYVLDLLMIYRNYNVEPGADPSLAQSIPVRRHAYIQKPFGPLQLRMEKYSEARSQITKTDTANGAYETKVVMILPLSGRLSSFERFLQNFNEVHRILSGRINLELVIVHFSQSEAENQNFVNLVTEFQKNVTNVEVFTLEEEFSRGLGLDYGIATCADDDLIFAIDVDFVYSAQVIQRVVMNTVQGERVYFPIIFSQYDPRFRQDPSEEFLLSNNNGYWRENGFGIAAFYKSDYDSIGGYDLNIQGWGKEDVLLYDAFISSQLIVVRAPDPELIHVYHEVACDKKLPQLQYEMCLGSQAATFGSRQALQKFVFDNRKKFLGKLSKIDAIHHF